MSEGNNSLINLGSLTEPATLLIEKISNAIGVLYDPRRIVKQAEAEAKAERIKALSCMEITDLEQRGLQRLIYEEGRKQENIENIIRQALPDLREDATPKNIEDYWLSSFFEKVKFVSDGDMQSLWGKILAGESNNPGSYSRRTLDVINALDKKDAALFTSLCSLVCVVNNNQFIPFVYDENADFPEKNINFSNLKHLESLGLIYFDADGLSLTVDNGYLIAGYFDGYWTLKKSEPKVSLQVGKVVLSDIGKQLFPICGAKEDKRFLDSMLEKWRSDGFEVTPCSVVAGK